MAQRSNNSKKDERKFLQKPIIDTIVRAVLTGIFVISLFLNIILIVVIVLMGVAAGDRGRGYGVMGYRKVYTDSGYLFSKAQMSDEIAVIHIDGIITEQDTRDVPFGYIESPLSGVKNRLDLVREDSNIRGVLLVVDSPGGGVTASDVLYRTIWRFKEETHLPVVALMKQVAASGGYYVAAASDYIIAYPTAITGSIGVIVYNFNIKELMDRFGVEYVAIKSGEHKDVISPFKPVDREEISWMQGIVDAMLEQFIEAVDRGRENLTREDVKKLANGQVLIAREALEKGLIDELGYFEDAVRVVSERAGVSSPVIVEFQRERSLRDLIGRVAVTLPRSLLRRMLLEEALFRSTGMHPFEVYYLWENGLTVLQ